MRRKQIKFDENKENPFVIEDGKPSYVEIKGDWNGGYFEAEQPITLEIGCGRGEYTLGLAKIYSDRNFIGMDYQGERIWYGASEARDQNMKNVGFLRTRAEQLGEFFAKNEINEIWITFPGPRPKNTEIHRRLTHPKFLDLYNIILKPGGTVHVKTDSDLVYDYTLEQLDARTDIEILETSKDIYSLEVSGDLDIKTHYEKGYLNEGKTIKYIKWRYL